MTRRLLAKLLPFLAVVPLTAKPELASGAEILGSFDAQDWARHFVAHVKVNPSIAADEETMMTWFANALMRGYDEHASRQVANSKKPTIEELEAILNQPDCAVHVMPNGEVRAEVAPIALR